MDAKYQFYEVVVVNSNMQESKHDWIDKRGVVLGKAQNDNGFWSYSVNMYGKNRSVHFMEDELSPTGERDDTWTGPKTHTIVSQDGKILYRYEDDENGSWRLYL